MKAKKSHQGISVPPIPSKMMALSENDSSDSDIEEIGRKQAPSSIKSHRMEISPGKVTPEEPPRGLSSSFDWGSPSNYTSTLDMDAIKISHPTPLQQELKTPLTTIAENWETAVVQENERTIPKLEAMEEESSSGSESEECSASESETGSNEGSSSSSCSSVESDSSSENDETKSKAENTKTSIKKTSSSHSSSKHSKLLSKFPPGGLGAGQSLLQEDKISSPPQLPSQSCPSPLPSSSQLSGGGSSQLHSSAEPTASKKPHILSISHKSRKNSGSNKRSSSSLLKKSSLVCQKSETLNSPLGTISDSGSEFDTTPSKNLNIILPTKKEENFLKSCKSSDIYRSGSSVSSSQVLTSAVKKRVMPKSSPSEDFSISIGTQSKSKDCDVMPQLYDFSTDKIMPVLQMNFTNNTKVLSTKQCYKSENENISRKILETKENNSDSNDCMIIDSPPNIGFQETKIQDNVDAYYTDDSKYKHKKNFIYGIYGKPNEKVKKDLKPSISSVGHKDKYLMSDSRVPPMSLEPSTVSYSDSSDSITSLSSCSDIHSPVQLEPMGKGSSLQNRSPSPSSVEVSDSSGSESSSDDDDLRPPTLMPELPMHSIQYKKAKPQHFKSRGGLKASKSKKKVEIACQTVESGINFAPPLPVQLPPVGNTPPMLIGFGNQPSKTNRGRPRKNPPMLQPEVERTGILDEDSSSIEEGDESHDSSDNQETKETKNHKGKLSVLFAAAKNWKKKQEKKEQEKNVYDFHEEVSDINMDSNDPYDTEESVDDTCDIQHSNTIPKKKEKHQGHKKTIPCFSKIKHFPTKNYLIYQNKSEKKKNKLENKILISSDDDEGHNNSKKKREKKLKKSLKSKHSKEEVIQTESCIQCQETRKTTVSQVVISDSSMTPDIENVELNEKIEFSPFLEDLPKTTIIKRESPERDAEPKVIFEIFSTKNNFASLDTTDGLIFSNDYCTLKPDEFWKKTEKKMSLEDKDATLKIDLSQNCSKQDSIGSSTFTTKASVKEMPSNPNSTQSFPPAFVPKNQVQQMVSTLASAKCSHSKSSKKRRDKEDKREYREVRNRLAYETCYETQSEDEDLPMNRRKKKGWKSKHKNVIDPVFLGELEHLIQDVACCHVELKHPKDLWLNRPSDSVPSIFRRRKIFTGRKKKDFVKLAKRTKTLKPTVEDHQVKTVDISESDEQRLPLKKRHHHMQGGDSKTVKNSNNQGDMKDSSRTTHGTLQIKSPEKICREFKNSVKGRLEDIQNINDIRLSPSKIPIIDKRSVNNTGLKIMQDKFNIKKPTAADRIVQKLGIQIKKESLESGNNETISERVLKVSEREPRQISKELDCSKDKLTIINQSEEVMRISGVTTHSVELNKPPSEVKHESELKSHTGEATFVDSIQNCIEKYTASEKNKMKHPYGTLQNYKEGAHSSTTYLQKKHTPQNFERLARCYSGRTNYVPIFSSPEPEISIGSGRESSLSQSSASSDSCSIINLDANSGDQGGSSSVNCGPGRASRQDLHNHLWKQGKSKVGSKSPSQVNIIPTCSIGKEEKSSTYRSLPPMGSRRQDHILIPPSKPLPTEPIRRVDLGPLGYCHKPLEKVPRFLGGQECVIRKVPQAIVAPFRRNPPETTPVTQVVPIHRASISHAQPSSITSTTPSTPITTLSASLPLNATVTSSTAPISITAIGQHDSLTDTTTSKGLEMSPNLGRMTPASKPGNEYIATENVSSEVATAKKKENSVPLSSEPKTLNPEALIKSPPKTRAKLDQQLKIAACKKGAKIKKCQVEVEKLRNEISHRALLGIGLAPINKSRLKEKTPDHNLSNNNDQLETQEIETKEKTEELCISEQLDLLEKRKNSLKELIKHSKEKECGDISSEKETKVSNAKNTPLHISRITKINEADMAVGKISGKDEDKLRAKKRRRKTNKTGFPTKLKKKKKALLQENDTQRERLVQVEKILMSSLICPQITKEKGKNLMSEEAYIVDNYSKEPPAENSIPSDTIFSNLSNLEATQQSTRGRPVRECRVQEENSNSSKSSASSKESSTPIQIPISLEKGIKRLSDSVRGRGRPPKCLKSKLIHSPFRQSNSSSYNPSPVSSDVESLDCRSFLDDESDGDSLNILPSSEDNYLSPSIAESSEVQSEQKKKKWKPTSLLKKNFLKAGLFSYDFKSNNENKGTADNFNKNKGIMYKPEEHPFSLLPPPYYCGRQLRQKKEDFALPYDLWHLHSTSMLPTRDIIATWNYKRVKNNVYYDVKPAAHFETAACQCKFPANEQELGCGDKCLNRMTYTECEPSSCHLGDRCSNMAIQKHLSSAVVHRFMTANKGWGVKTKTDITKGTYILEYLGEVVTDKEFKQRMLTDYQQDSHHYCLHVGEGMVIDGHRMGGECRFVNHSCKPNCEMQKWSVNGLYRMALFSRTPISANEELTYDYNFSLFNPHEGQVCRCGSEDCRGVIGGKGQRNKPKTPLKSQKIKEKNTKVEDVKKPLNPPKSMGKTEEVKTRPEELTNRPSLTHFVPLKPLSIVQQHFIRSHSVLLIRNLEKIRKVREMFLNCNKIVAPKKKLKKRQEYFDPTKTSESSGISGNTGVKEEVFKTGLTALTTLRSVQTRRLAIAQDHPDVSKVVQVAKTFQGILETLRNIKTVNGEMMMNYFAALPSKEDFPQYNLKISEPIDTSSIENSLNSGMYQSVAHIDQDILLLFQNNIRFYGTSHKLGEYANTLRQQYIDICKEQYNALSEIVGLEGVRCLSRPKPPGSEQVDDIINCPCGQFKDEGVMVQCEECACWQHTDCVKPNLDPEDMNDDKFVCEPCSSKNPKLDIALVPQPDFASSGETHFVSMEREDGLHVTLGMTVYVLRALKDSNKDDPGKMNTNKKSSVTAAEKIFRGPGGIPHKSISPIKGPSKEAASLLSGNYPTYKTVTHDNISTDDLDIFRVERLWVNEAGTKFAFGYHYLRPHETFHEPTRRFFDNEVFRVPLYEVLPLDTMWRQCWVMDPVTFCRGRPKTAQEEHVYICEYRVDKTARLFNKISKPKYPICTKFYAFTNFDLRLKVTRSYTPHEVPDLKKVGSKPSGGSSKARTSKEDLAPHLARNSPSGSPCRTTELPLVEAAAESEGGSSVRKGKPKPGGAVKAKRQVVPLSSVLERLLVAQGDKEPLDASGLLEPSNRKRKRTVNSMQK